MKQKITIGVAAALVFVGGFCFSMVNAQMIGVTLPSVPTGVSASLNGSSQISVSWGASTESSGTIEGYYVYRNGTKVATTAGTLFVDSGMLPGVYLYTVSSYDANNISSAQSVSVSVTYIPDTTPPTAPAGVTIAGATSTNSSYAQTPLTISWNGSTDNVGVVGYYVYRNGVNIVSSTSAFSGTSITDTVLPGSYNYTVAAYDAAQNISNRSTPIVVTIAVDTTPPSVPKNISVQQVSGSGVNLSWASSTDNIAVAGYQVFRNGTQIASTTVSSYADNGLTVGNTYSYMVAAYDGAGNISGPSFSVQEYIQPVNGPSAPVILSAMLVGTSTVKLSWAVAYDNIPLAGYTVYRNGAKMVSSATSTQYLDENLDPGTYVYTMTVADVSGAVSTTSLPMNAIVPVLTPTVATSTITTPPPILSSSTSVNPASVAPLTQSLYFGLRNAQVLSLQLLLVQNGDLLPEYTTGYFGNLTLTAVKKFQCDQNVVCTGGAGWGLVGPKTRKALNSL